MAWTTEASAQSLLAAPDMMKVLLFVQAARCGFPAACFPFPIRTSSLLPFGHMLHSKQLQQKLLEASPVCSTYTSSFFSFQLVFRVVSIIFLSLMFAFFCTGRPADIDLFI